MAKRRFSDLPPAGRAAIVALATVQATLCAAAQLDISRRPAGLVRGPKWRWRLVSFVNVVGPLAYFRYGRRSLRSAR